MKNKFKKGKSIGKIINTKTDAIDQSLEINFTLTDKDFERALPTPTKKGKFVRLKFKTN